MTDSDDLLTRLERIADTLDITGLRSSGELVDLGVARIRELEKKIEVLRDALKPLAEAAGGFDMAMVKNPDEWAVYGGKRSSHGETVGEITVADCRKARAAMEELDD
jgi:hypothetical protein